VLVPYPHAADDHQTRNAETLGAAGAALVLADRDLGGASLAAAVSALVADDGRRRSMAAAARSLGIPDAGSRIADVLDSILDRDRRAVA
jgi:UDP-N-acetylglucosamine--N-acetylmuramyl-(pentapeptide) pyrophosphoryl-undecaprenol N-acetylglucosamine transferase